MRKDHRFIFSSWTRFDVKISVHVFFDSEKSFLRREALILMSILYAILTTLLILLRREDQATVSVNLWMRDKGN